MNKSVNVNKNARPAFRKKFLKNRGRGRADLSPYVL
jgi:hypothetical protein